MLVWSERLEGSRPTKYLVHYFPLFSYSTCSCCVGRNARRYDVWADLMLTKVTVGQQQVAVEALRELRHARFCI